MASSAANEATTLRSHLISRHRTLDLYGLVVQSLHRAATEDCIHRLLTAKGDEPKASRPFVVVIVHDNSILDLGGRMREHHAT